MSRLNYLSDQELALDGIDQELKILERLVAEGTSLDASQLQLMAGYRDRMSMLVAPTRGFDGNADDEMQSDPSASSQDVKAAEWRIEDNSIDEWCRSIRKSLDEALA